MRKYVDDYEIAYEEDEKGREKKVAVYKGDYFEVNLDQPSLIKYKRNNLILLAVILLSHIAGGFVANQGMYYFFVALPYVAAFLPLYFLTAGVLRLSKEKKQYRRDEADLSFERIKKASTFLLILLIMTVLGEAIFLIFFTDQRDTLEFLYLSLESLALFAVYLMIRARNSITIQEIKS